MEKVYEIKEGFRISIDKGLKVVTVYHNRNANMCSYDTKNELIALLDFFSIAYSVDLTSILEDL